MKNLSIVISVFLFSCNTQPGLEASVKKYMTDSVVPRFNDPASYEFVSAKVDTLTGADYLNNIKRSYLDTDTSLLGTAVYNEKKNEYSSLAAIPGYADSVLLLNIEVKYRGKNKMGALILDKTELRYYPKDNRIIEVN